MFLHPQDHPGQTSGLPVLQMLWATHGGADAEGTAPARTGVTGPGRRLPLLRHPDLPGGLLGSGRAPDLTVR